MAKSSAQLPAQNMLFILTATVVSVVAVAALYWAKAVFIPVACALFLCFLLNPLVRILQRLGVGRIPSVSLVVLAAGLLLGALGWLVTLQVTSLLSKLPDYSVNIQTKIKSIQSIGAGVTSMRLEKMFEELGRELKTKPRSKESTRPGDADPTAAEPINVSVQSEGPRWLARLLSYLGSAAEAFASLGLTLILAVFMLLNREDLRNRFLRLVGHGHMLFPTKAVDDAGQRISRYLLTQALLNCAYGLTLAIGFFAIGVEYAFLWGLLTAVLRYVPYVGTWLSALFPITISFAMSEVWWQPLAVIGIFVVVEVLAYSIFEPWLFGHSMGVSTAAQILSVAFWAFLWGPIGLVLAAPLTVCLLVLGKYVSDLKFLDVLLGDEPALDTHLSIYQRLLARDLGEATELALAHLKTAPSDHVFDDLLVPALTFAKRDLQRDDLTQGDAEYVLRATEEILADVGEQRAALEAGIAKPEAFAAEPVRLIGCPARDEFDKQAFEMLRQTLDATRWELEVVAVGVLAAELSARVAEEQIKIVCIGALPPGGLAHTRYLCKRLRARCPQLMILVGRWGLKGNVEHHREQLIEAGADRVTTTILETRNELNALLPVVANGNPPRRKVRESAAPSLPPLRTHSRELGGGHAVARTTICAKMLSILYAFFLRRTTS